MSVARDSRPPRVMTPQIVVHVEKALDPRLWMETQGFGIHGRGSWGLDPGPGVSLEHTPGPNTSMFYVGDPSPGAWFQGLA